MLLLHEDSQGEARAAHHRLGIPKSFAVLHLPLHVLHDAAEVDKHRPSWAISFLLQQSHICFTMLAGTLPECIILRQSTSQHQRALCKQGHPQAANQTRTSLHVHLYTCFTD